MNNILTATKRSKTDKLADIRNNGMVPAVVYGARVENTLLSVSSLDFAKILKTAGETSTILLEMKGDKNIKLNVLIHEIQKDPVKDIPIHIDFLAVDLNKPVEVEVPLVFEGVSEAEKIGLGILTKVLHNINIEALPKDIPQTLEVDLSKLNTLEDQILVKNIKLPSEVKLITNEDEVVALITPIREEKESEEESVDLSSIEVEKKGKKEEGGETNKESKE